MSKASGQPGMIPAGRVFRDHFTSLLSYARAWPVF
jgi:hypothetical protein